MDYEVFVLSCIREEYHRGHSQLGSDWHCSAQPEKQLLELLAVGVKVLVGHGRRHQFEAHTIQSALGRGQLGDYVSALGAFVDEALQTTDLALESP